MNRDLQELVDAAWVETLGADRSLLHAGGVRVVAGDVGRNDAMSFMFGETCIFLVRAEDLAHTKQHLTGLDPATAFIDTTLRQLLGEGAQVDGPSLHMYVDETHFAGTPDAAAARIDGRSPELIDFLRSNSRADWAESGFPERPELDDTSACYWLLRDENRVVAAGNMTEWRGRPSDVGVLTSGSERRRGLARRLVGTMVDAALPSVEVVRYRALATNAPSVAVARSLGFQTYGANFRGRRQAG